MTENVDELSTKKFQLLKTILTEEILSFQNEFNVIENN